VGIATAITPTTKEVLELSIGFISPALLFSAAIAKRKCGKSPASATQTTLE